MANPLILGPEFTPNVIGGATPDPFSQPLVWDTIMISGIPWQGRIEIRGAARSYKWDIKHAPGVEGFNQTYRGKPPKPFTIKFFMWTASMYNYWQTFYVKLFQYTGPALVVPVSVYHPSLALLGISGITADEVGAVELQSPDLMFAATVKVHEFYPPIPTNATSTPLAKTPSTPNPPGNPPPTFLASQAASAAAQQRTANVLGLAGGGLPH